MGNKTQDDIKKDQEWTGPLWDGSIQQNNVETNYQPWREKLTKMHPTVN